MVERYTASEEMRTPAMPAAAGRYIAAIEEATSPRSVPLDILTGGEDITRMLERQLQVANNHWNRHEELFFSEGDCNLEKLNYHELFELSRNVIRDAKLQSRLRLTAHLGITTMQLVTAGAEIANDSSRIIVKDTPNDRTAMAKAIAVRSEELARDVFAETVANRLKGDYRRLPPHHLGYLACLMHKQAAFWRTNKLQMDNWGLTSRFPTAVDDKVEDLLLQYPALALSYDHHSYMARPDREYLYAKELGAICDFDYHLSVNGGNVEPSGPEDNVAPAMAHIDRALRSAAEREIPPARRLSLIARDASTIADVAKRNSFGDLFHERGLVYFEGPPEDPRLVVGMPELPKNIVEHAVEKLSRKIMLAGTCTARDFVPLPAGGETHHNAQVFYAGFQERLGNTDTALVEQGGNVYLHLGLFSVHYALLASDCNSFNL